MINNCVVRSGAKKRKARDRRLRVGLGTPPLSREPRAIMDKHVLRPDWDAKSAKSLSMVPLMYRGLLPPNHSDDSKNSPVSAATPARLPVPYFLSPDSFELAAISARFLSSASFSTSLFLAFAWPPLCAAAPPPPSHAPRAFARASSPHP